MALNPVEQRLAMLAGHWVDFRDDGSKRLLVWQLRQDAVRMAQCFFEVQKHELPYATGDLFLVFNVPFEHSAQYARDLKLTLRGQYEASREDLERQGLSTDWEPPASNDSARGTVRYLSSLGSSYHRTIGHLAVVLLPSSFSDPNAFAQWVSRVLDCGLPERLRLVLVDTVEQPWLDPKLLADTRTSVQRPALDGMATAQETFAQEPTTGPAGVFRNLLLGVAVLLEKGSADQVKAKALDAYKFAQEQGWKEQEVVLRLMIAGAWLKEARFDEAAQGYRAAREVAQGLMGQQHPSARKLILQTWFGEAGVHLAAAHPAEAVRCYDEAAIVAQKDGNLVLMVEALRMGAFCEARQQAHASAIERGDRVLKVAELIKPASRSMTTLPIAAANLLRSVEPQRVVEMEQIKADMDSAFKAALNEAERYVVERERDHVAVQVDQVDASLRNTRETAQARAEHRLDAVLSHAGEEFRRRFLLTRQLLGARWLLSDPNALPATSEPINFPAMQSNSATEAKL